MQRNSEIIEITYKSTKYYLVKGDGGYLAFDIGWPGTYKQYKDRLKEKELSASSIKWVLVSHFHIDHAGLFGMFADKEVECIVFENQNSAIDQMEKMISKKRMPYWKIDKEKITHKKIEDSAAWLKSIGIQGEVIKTTYHSSDSISLIINTETALIGDLPPISAILNEDKEGQKVWSMLKSKGVKKIKPAHAPEFNV